MSPSLLRDRQQPSSEKTASMWVPQGCLEICAEFLLLMFKLAIRIGETQHASLALELGPFLSKSEQFVCLPIPYGIYKAFIKVTARER